MQHLLDAHSATGQALTGVLLAALGGLLSTLTHILTGFYAVPGRIRKLFANPEVQKAALSFVRAAAIYANLDGPQRKEEATRRLDQWLNDHAIHLSPAELSLLVELAYHLLLRTNPGAIQPGPLEWGQTTRPGTEAPR
jgi:hypothetical protein